MKKLCAGIMACGVVFGVSNVTAQAAPANDKNCGDFGGDKQAVMDFWYNNGYSATNDPHDLDRDNDGLPCETSKGDWDNFVAKKEAAKKEETAQETTEPEEKAEDNIQTTPEQPVQQPSETKEQGEALPKTATNDVAMMGLAGLMAAAGGVLMMKRRKK
ncbi:LPXTG cell wall anchor domain-containing protein [Priestia filamentosa]|uniref:LPXTG cell wall anchor domain-containing protein n=1 Tax=Priestia filamentosa TaxID=1402861 RepID=UPI00397A89DA